MIKYFSHYYQAYVCDLLSDTFENYTSDGYYSFGKINNFYEKNKFLINQDVDKIFRYKSSENILYGDYYIKNNKLNIYREENIDSNLFLLEKEHIIILFMMVHTYILIQIK